MTTKAQRSRWQTKVTKGAEGATEATRLAMATAVEGSSGKWKAAELFRPGWWTEAVDRFIMPTLEQVAAAAIVAAGQQYGMENVARSDDWVPIMADSIAGQQRILHHYADTIAARVEVLADRGNTDGWDPERMADALGVALEYDAVVAAAGPVSFGLAWGIGETESHTLIQAAPIALWNAAGRDGTKTWVCTFQRSRESHVQANGQTVAMSSPFVLANEHRGHYPGDHTLPGKERVSCLCYTVLKPKRG